MPVEIKKGDKIQLVNPMGCFTNIGEVCEVTKVDGEEIQFKFGGFHLGCMSHDEFAKYFVKCEEPRKVSEDDVKMLLAHSEITVLTVFDKCTIVAVRLPNGFIITESSACVDPLNYDVELGKEICMKNIEDKLYELEGYHLQAELFESGGVANSMEDNEW